MLILIEHPEHGRTHVYSNAELQSHIEKGWEVVEEHKPFTAPKFTVVDSIPEFKRKAGRPKRV